MKLNKNTHENQVHSKSQRPLTLEIRHLIYQNCKKKLIENSKSLQITLHEHFKNAKNCRYLDLNFSLTGLISFKH